MSYALIVDDVSMNRMILEDLLEEDFDVLQAENGQKALELVRQHGEEISVMLLDLVMPEMDGFGVLDEMKRENLLDRIPVLIITGETNPEIETRCLSYGVSDFLLKPFNETAVRLRANNAASLYALKNHLSEKVDEQTRTLAEQNRRLRKLNEDIITLLGGVVEARNQESGDHILRVREFTRIIAADIMENCPEYELTPEKIGIMATASTLHDVGKIMISDAILLKPGRFTPEEFNTMKQHTVLGCEVLQRANFMWDEDYQTYCEEICHYHHERYDGRGYPEGLKEEEIPISAQIAGLADVFDALTTKRVYKDAYTPETAFQMILNGECGTFSEKIYASLRRCKEQMFAKAQRVTA